MTVTIWPDGSEVHTRQTKIGSEYHRVDGPAVTRPCGTKEWYQYGRKHRLDGPAVERADGTKYWYQQGMLHRTTGPSIEWHDGDWDYHLNGNRHRTDGPAIFRNKDNQTFYGGKQYYYFVNGNCYNTLVDYHKAAKHWNSYEDVTQDEIQHLIGKFKIVEW